MFKTFNHNFVTPLNLQQIQNEEGVRQYVTPNGPYESVTTYIGRLWDKSGLVAWKKRLGEAKANAESNRAANRGSQLHNCIEAYIRNHPIKELLSEDVLTKGLFLKVKPFLDKIDNIKLIETPIYSDELKLAGKPDCIADYESIFSTVDFKTSTRDKLAKYITTYWLQTSMYSIMFNERYGVMPEQSVIIMAVEENPQPLIFQESTYEGMVRLQAFIEDPIKFQKDEKL